MPETEGVGEVKQRHQIPSVWPNSGTPAPYSVGIGPEAASQFGPRQTGRLLEHLKAPGEVLGGIVGNSGVMNALSRHRFGPAARPSTGLC